MWVGIWQGLLVLAILVVPEIVLIWVGIRKARPENALSRGGYAKRVSLITAGPLFLFFVETVAREARAPAPIQYAALIGVLAATLMWTVLRARYTALRLYDRGRARPYLAYLLAIPFVGLALTVYLMFAPSRLPAHEDSKPRPLRGDAFRRPGGWTSQRQHESSVS